jgi:excisionase family DNA binding protein
MQGDRTLLTGPLVSMPDEPPVFYSVPQAARHLGMSPATLYRAIDAGQFPAIRIRGRLKVLCEVVDEILAAARAGQTVDVAKWTAARRLAAGRHEAVKGGAPDAA